MNSTDTLILNFTDEGLERTITVTQYDSGRRVRCYLAGISGEAGMAMVYCRKPSGNEAYVTAEIIDDHTVDFDLTQQMIAETGISKGQLQLIGGGKALTSFLFLIQVRGNMVSESRITSTDEYEALQDLLIRLEEFNPVPITEEEIDNLKGVVD